MTLMTNGKEVAALALGGNEFYPMSKNANGTISFNGHIYEDVVVAHNVSAHSVTYRGNNLGAFTDSYASAVASMQFTGMYVGDKFTQNGHTYKIGGLNYLLGADHNEDLPPHLLMITDVLTKREMNPGDYTSGGFAGSEMWKSYFPTVVKQLKTDFGSHLLTWNEYLTTGTDGNAANQGGFFPVQASMMNTVMYWGSPSKYSTPFKGTNYNIGIETKQLPIMGLHTDEQNNGNTGVWLRDIYSSSGFARAFSDGDDTWDGASAIWNGVRAFFLIG